MAVTEIPKKGSTSESNRMEQSKGHKDMDHRGSIAAGMLEPNFDIRRGPITTEGTFQEKNFHNKTGRATIVPRDGGISQNPTQGDANTQANKGNATGSSTNQQGLSQTGIVGSSSDKGKSSAGKRNSSRLPLP